MGEYRELKIYEKSYKAALAIYRMTETFPKEEKYGIISQMTISIALNIAEGNAKRESKQEFKRFLQMSMGSANEMSVLIDFAKDLGYIDKTTHERASQEYEEIGKMIRGFIKGLEQQ
jgi:four helix bundle protein